MGRGDGPLLAALPGVSRLRLVPTGLLSLLPLHAAWHGDGTGTRHYACDQTRITYSPNLRLADAEPPPPDRLLAVGSPAESTAPFLPHVAAELDAACAAFPTAIAGSSLLRPPRKQCSLS